MPKIVLTQNQWARISEILGNLGILSIASLIIPYVTNESDFKMILTGILLTLLSWIGSIIIARKE